LFFKKLVEKPILLDVHEHRARISTSGGKRIQWSPTAAPQNPNLLKISTSGIGASF